MIGITRVMVSESRSDKATARTEFRQWSRARKKSAEVEEVEQPMPPKKPRPIIFTQEWPHFTPISGERGVDRTGSAAIITQHYRPPSSSGLGLRILSPATGVRLPLGVLSNLSKTRSSLRVFAFDPVFLLLNQICPVCIASHHFAAHSSAHSRSLVSGTHSFAHCF